MDREVKIYRVEGYMLMSHDRNPKWQIFRKEILALKPEHALEKIYSELGSRHKLRRKHIRIIRIKEISLEEASDPVVISLYEMKRFVK